MSMAPKDGNIIKDGIAALLKELVGTTKDTGGSTTAGTVMAKENAILTKANTISTATGRIGNAGDTGGSQTAGSMMAKLNAMLGTMKNGGMPIVKSIQWGYGGTSGVKEISISPVNVDKSLAFVIGMTNSKTTPYMCFLGKLESNLIQITMKTQGNDISYNWYVVEFY